MSLTIVYVTSRPNPAIKYFFDSLKNEVANDWRDIRVVVVDFWAQPLPDLQWEPISLSQRKDLFRSWCVAPDYIHVAPKPTVWQGQYKLTPKHYFDAGNARNTGVCFARDGYIVFVDDLSVLKPRWLHRVRQHEKTGVVCCGAFQKVKRLIVENGGVVSFDYHPQGLDSRMKNITTWIPKKCPPEWAFGCSLGMPVEALLKINGYPEALTAGMGYEDSITGVAIAKHGYEFVFDPVMMTLEDEDLHHNQFVLRRVDPGKSPADKSHAMLAIGRVVDHFENDFGGSFGPDLRALRAHILKGGEFPIRFAPDREWWTKLPLKQFDL